jgi:outer membrane protein assembly factor BamB
MRFTLQAAILTRYPQIVKLSCVPAKDHSMARLPGSVQASKEDKTMFRRSIVVLIALASVIMCSAVSGEAAYPPAAPVVSVDQQSATSTGVVSASRLNVRSGPGVSYRVLGQLRQGDVVRILDQASGWLKIVYPAAQDGQAWVSGNFVRIDGAVEPAGVVAVPTAGSAGKLVFQTRNGGDIYVIDANGTGLRKLTTGFEPALSPDGTQVAFTRFSTPMGLYLIDVDGKNERLVFGANRARSPSWSPDGRSIAFEYAARSEQCSWLPIGCVTPDEWNAISGGADCATIGRDEVCFGSYPGHTRYFTNLALIDLVTGETRDLPAGPQARAPIHHPIEGLVLHLDSQGLLATGTEGNNPPWVVVNLPNLVGPGVYSPDGQAIHGMRRLHDHWDLWRWNADGSGASALTSQPVFAPKPINNVSPAVSPDGRQVVFLTDRNGKWEMYVMNADGSNQRPFAPQALSGIEFSYDFNSDRMVNWGK